MVVKFGYSQYMPSPYAVYVSKFGDRVLAELKKCKPFARYHKDDAEYEVTPDVYEKLKRFELAEELNSLPKGKLYEPFVYHTDYEFQYQDDAVSFLEGKYNGLINFSQGCGKSLTAMKILNHRKIRRALIVTGVSNLQEEWIKDAEKHKVDGISYRQLLNMRIVASDPAASVAKRINYLKEQHINEETFTDLIGIESLRSEELVAALNALNYEAIVVDEVQSAKGMKAEQTQGLHELVGDEAQLRLALSGTPALNDPLEFYSVLRFLRVLYYKSEKDQCSRSAFNNYYGEWGFDYWGHFVCKGYRNLDQLAELIAPVLIYAPKSLLNLPPKYRDVVQLEMPNPQYQEKLALYHTGTKKVKKAGYKTIQALASELQVMTSTAETKFDYIKDEIAQGLRPLVFSQYTTVLDYFEKRFSEEGRTVLYYHGKLSMKERLKVLEQWRSGAGDVLLLSIATARYGLNLQQTQHAVFLEPPTSPAILEQAEDRLWRIGQDKPVYSAVLLAGESDESDWATIQGKMDSLAFFNNK